MSHYPSYTLASAPAASQPVLQRLQQVFGLVPNIAAKMAASPMLINGFIGLFERVHAGSLSESQIQVLLLTNAVTNASAWPVAFHSALALQQGVPQADVDAIRRGGVPGEVGSAALSTVARRLIEQRGRLSRSEQEVFFKAGFSPEQLLEVVAVVAASAITNYTSSVTQPELEAPFEAYAWQASAS